VVESASRLLDAVRRLNESLDPSRVLVRVCEEATRLLEADNASVFLGSGADGVRVAATYGHPAAQDAADSESSSARQSRSTAAR
jgi:hypothetical protein